MNTCPIEISPDCPGHTWSEKLSTCLISALYSADADEVTGTVDGFGIHVSLFIQEKAETIDGNAYPETVKVTIPAGTYCLLIENSQGHVTMLDYDTADKAQAAFDLWDEQYSAWCDVEDARELSITSGTGRIGA